MQRIVLSILILMPLTSFQNNIKGVTVVFKNGSNEDFQELQVNILGQFYYFHDVKAGNETNSIVVTETYKYCYARAITCKDTVICQPDDYVGEILLKTGKLTISFFLYPEDYKYRILSIKDISYKDTSANISFPKGGLH
jgi:hypothetical protein